LKQLVNKKGVELSAPRLDNQQLNDATNDYPGNEAISHAGQVESVFKNGRLLVNESTVGGIWFRMGPRITSTQR